MNRILASKRITLAFFSIGSLLFLIQIITSELNAITVMGYYYLLLSVFINFIILIVLIFALMLDKNKTETLKSIGILTLNIPIAGLYAYIVLNHVI